MADPTSNDPRPQLEDRLLQAAAAALRKRRELDREIARLVAQPFDRDAPERVRDAQSEATQAGTALDQERSAHDPPVIDPAVDDPEPRSRRGSSWPG